MSAVPLKLVPPPFTRDLILGVDPGLSGALAFYNFKTKKLEAVFDMPLNTVSSSESKSHINTFQLSLIVDGYSARTCLAVIEEVASRPKEGVVSVFRFGFVTGLVTGVIAAHHIPPVFTPPSVWKGLMNLSSNKNLSRAKASTLFPDMAEKFKRVKDDGRAEAALLAFFGERFL